MDTSSTSRNRTLLLLIFSLVSMAGLLGIAASQSLLVLVAALLSPKITAEDLFFGLSTVTGLAFVALLFIPLVLDSLRSLRGETPPMIVVPPLGWRRFLLLLGLWAGMFILASLITFVPVAGPFLAAPFAMLSILLPAVTSAWVGAGGLLQASRRRLLAIFGISLTGSTLLVVLLQFAAIVFLVIALLLLVDLPPDFPARLREFANEIEKIQNPEEVLNFLLPYLLQPEILTIVFIMAAIVAPLSEEPMKPLAVWLLGRQLRSPAEGFALGAISGAGFAIIEGAFSLSQMIMTPYIGIPARLAASVMHVALSAIMGWGIASLLLEKKWLSFFGAYLASASLHGLWNASAVLAIYGSLRITQETNILNSSILLAGLSLLSMAVIAVLLALPLLNAHLRRQAGALNPSSEKDLGWSGFST